ncbi:MAG: AAA family ATPase [bacterium]
MIEELFKLSQNFINIYNREYKRYFLKVNPLTNRFSIITGQRGVGKTTAMIQYILSSYNNDIFTDKAIYVQADHFLVGKYSLYEIAEQFYKLGGELLCFDEIHKYSNWSKELKSINDTFPKLKIIASGSSALEIYKGTHDLSRRAVVFKMAGLSFREFIEITTESELQSYGLEEITKNHQKISAKAITMLEQKNRKVLALFKEYLSYGYYPYFKEYADKNIFRLTLEQNIHTTLESDLMLIHPSLNGNSIKKIKRLLSIIASSVPFTPDLKNLKNILDIGDERTLKIYLKYLEDAGIIMSISKGKGGLRELEKPEKIYLNNPNLIHAITDYKTANIGNIRETFFLNMLNTSHKVSIPSKGDFLIDNKNIFEIGGKNKNFDQIKNLKDSFLVLDDTETGFKNKIPLWLFGFLY